MILLGVSKDLVHRPPSTLGLSRPPPLRYRAPCISRAGLPDDFGGMVARAVYLLVSQSLRVSCSRERNRSCCVSDPQSYDLFAVSQ